MRKSNLKIVPKPTPEKNLCYQLNQLRSLLKTVVDVIDFKIEQINELEDKRK